MAEIKHSLNLLIVDDDNLFAQNLKLLIASEGNFGRIEIKNDIRTAFEFLTCDIDTDIILLDIGLPKYKDFCSGIDAIPHILSLNNSLKIIMLSVFNEDQKVFDALKAGASGYILKGDAESKIVSSIYEVEEGGGAFSPEVALKLIKFFRKKKEPEDETLSNCEKDVLELFADGFTKKDIAGKLNKSIHTVDSHIRNIYTKLHVSSKAAVVKEAIKRGII
ncbi:MAG: response regulator transcription factor [Ignavibacteriales bacterium]|nr:response regulator transcription factor [Ignavibacteriales bacterium]MCF8306012.1 response regulator transcription factor [Ignavibacteriales bacterium]MCF8315734.1 response regulator transcription factor [Ignavibacteriales bacterium]MCF8437072.1 response regulator transcription factor [Ignavibacteriales bacterium]